MSFLSCQSVVSSGRVDVSANHGSSVSYRRYIPLSRFGVGVVSLYRVQHAIGADNLSHTIIFALGAYRQVTRHANTVLGLAVSHPGRHHRQKFSIFLDIRK